jgi:hypothetical protein
MDCEELYEIVNSIHTHIQATDNVALLAPISMKVYECLQFSK